MWSLRKEPGCRGQVPHPRAAGRLDLRGLTLSGRVLLDGESLGRRPVAQARVRRPTGARRNGQVPFRVEGQTWCSGSHHKMWKVARSKMPMTRAFEFTLKDNSCSRSSSPRIFNRSWALRQHLSTSMLWFCFLPSARICAHVIFSHCRKRASSSSRSVFWKWVQPKFPTGSKRAKLQTGQERLKSTCSPTRGTFLGWAAVAAARGTWCLPLLPFLPT